MTIIKRADLGRPLTWDELDDNFQQVDDLTAAASAAVSSASASATAAATSATASATSATDAANSAADAAAAIVSAVKSTLTFATGGTLNSNLDRISDGTYLYYWTGTYPVTVPGGSTVSGTGGIGIGFWAVDNDLLLRQSLSQNDGFKLVGQVDSIASLRTVNPTEEGQHILVSSYYQGWNATYAAPFGGGQFVSISGTAVDDDGHIIVPSGSTSYYWLRVTDDVNLFDYGIYLQTVTICRTTAAVGMADKVQAAINRAITMNVPLVSPFSFDQNPSYFQNGILLEKSITATGLKVTTGEFPWYCNNVLYLSSYSEDLGLTTAMATSEKYVIFNKNATFNSSGYKDYGSNFRGMNWDSWCIRNVGDRTSHLGGIMMLCCHAKFTRLRGVNFYGTAVNMGSSYDYEIGEIGQEMSGAANYYAIDAQTYPASDSYDEHNSYTIHAVLSHYGYERGYRITGSKGFIGRIHSEGLYVTVNTPFAGYSFDFAAAGGLTYTNNFAGGTGTYIGEISEDPASSNTLDSNTLIGTYGTSIGTLYTNRLSNIVFYAAGTAGCNVGTIRCTGDVRINSGCRTTINGLVMSGDLSILSIDSTVLRANIAGDVTMYGSLSSYTIGGNAVLMPGGTLLSGTITGSLISNQASSGVGLAERTTAASMSISGGGGGGSCQLRNVTITGTLAASDSAIVYGDRVSVNTSLNLTGTSINFHFTGKSTFQNITFVTGVTGVWAFDIGTTVFSSSVTNWTAPTGSARTGTTTINPATGLVLTYLGSTWKTLINAPA